MSGTNQISFLQAFTAQLICGLGLAVAFWVARNFYSIDLISDPCPTLRLLSIVETPIVILVYSWFRLNPQECSYLKAVARSILAFPLGALLIALGAIALGAPIHIEYLSKTIFYSLLMSSFTFVPAAAVFGTSWTHWQRIFAHTKPTEAIEYMICIQAYGAVIGAWFGAWPMPLDWERPWQEWPICVSYGAIGGYLVGFVASLGFVIAGHGHHLKKE
ncbi:hypothetical protein K2173_020923 [Erythroxylum novogranatense]|uniref:Phosphatidylinositol-glycan biosynthesis class F protein n=1 Tax=Erythroxylum novogranatense TaxID=1862640 RepID=A0AAV8TMH7_9ROSI|nr:hypothetical protein K2173_020923 [Erythroxylum novogranatense]